MKCVLSNVTLILSHPLKWLRRLRSDVAINESIWVSLYDLSITSLKWVILLLHRPISFTLTSNLVECRVSSLRIGYLLHVRWCSPSAWSKLLLLLQLLMSHLSTTYWWWNISLANLNSDSWNLSRIRLGSLLLMLRRIIRFVLSIVWRKCRLFILSYLHLYD